jgi:hypothetical protein
LVADKITVDGGSLPVEIGYFSSWRNAGARTPPGHPFSSGKRFAMLHRLHMSFASAVYIWFLGLLLGGALVQLAWNYQEGHTLWKPLVVLAFVLVSTALALRKAWIKSETLRST